MNRLRFETSPYLLSHAQNPVDWYPWGKEALQKSKKEQKPIFLSIGYSACHWCHVMEKESFENALTANLMNEHFINIKVDREERQDLDHIYMRAVQLLTGRGGWPMSVFLTPDLKPFYGGTYFPPEDKHGLPSFNKILAGVAHAWRSKKAEIIGSSEDLLKSIVQIQTQADSSSPSFSLEQLIENSIHKIEANFDPVFGGFGNAPKFFHSMDLQLVLQQYSKTKKPELLNVLTKTLSSLAEGGIYDQLAGGFHRYSTDREWLVPHFEKMLYDNALLAGLYIEAFRITKNAMHSRIACETLDYIQKEMTSDEGGFFSTQDADSEGVEGKFYVWSKKEILSLLGTETGEIFCKIYSVTEEGNWEHTNILHLKKSFEESAAEMGFDLQELEDTLAFAKRKLSSHRSSRIAPNKDEKIILSWNAMMIDTLARASKTFSNEQYLSSAEKCAEFILTKMKNSDGLLHSYKDGKSILKAYLDDWGFFIHALVSLYECTQNEKWLRQAKELSTQLLETFYEPSQKEFFFTGKYETDLILRPKEFHDGATPSATGITFTALSRLGKILGDDSLLNIVSQSFGCFAGAIEAQPGPFSQMLFATGYFGPDCKEIVVFPGKDAEEHQAVLEMLNENCLGSSVLVHPGEILNETGLIKNRKSLRDQTTVYLCQNQTCSSPLVGLDEVKDALKTLF